MDGLPRWCAHGEALSGGRELDAEGFIDREGSLAYVTPVFVPVVQAVRARLPGAFGAEGLHSAYLYGSIPRGTATPGISDLDLLLALHHEPKDGDRADARRLEAGLDRDLPQIDGAGILLHRADTLLSEAERNDMGWFLACLCTPLSGPDLAGSLPRYRPTSLLARETNGDFAQSLARVRARAATTATAAGRTALSRSFARKTVRTGFSLVMTRWDGWTSDLRESAEVFGAYHPQRAEQMRTAADAARRGSLDPGVMVMLLEDLGPWLAAEYAQVHGVKGSAAGSAAIAAPAEARVIPLTRF